MPTYSYECQSCEYQGEFFASMDDCRRSPACEECGKETKRVILSAPMGYVHFPAAGGHGYVSPVSGKFIETKRARIDDLKRTGSRPYEGREQEEKVAKKYREDEQRKSDDRIGESVKEMFHQLPPRKRKLLEGS